MKTELTTPKAILIGMSLIAAAIASIPYSKSIVGDVYAHSEGLHKIAICSKNGFPCVDVTQNGYLKIAN
jgi:hypothetical protein